MSDAKTPPLYLRPAANNVPEQHFADDLYQREELAKRLTSMLARLPDGAVISIEAPWGEGKTWFGTRWAASLSKGGYRTAFIDCFQRDHLDDPFPMLASAFVELAREESPAASKKVLGAAKKVGAMLLPTAAKVAASAAGHWLIGNAGIAEDLAKALDKADESAAAALEKLAAKKLEDYAKEQTTVAAFKSALGALAGASEKPIVVILDELDRCRPDFAVRTIERAKHFFDCPKIIFVLLANRAQLEAAVKGLYGSEVDANAYLGKFIQLSLLLPKRVAMEPNGADDNQTHCQATLKRYGIPVTSGISTFATVFGMLASVFSMSLRDVERGVALLALAHPVGESAFYMAWPIALKVSKPALFAALLANDKTAHKRAAELAQSLEGRARSFDHLMKLFAFVHTSALADDELAVPEEVERLLPERVRMYGLSSFFRSSFERVDLSVSR